MKYPSFLQKDDVMGITALSGGIGDEIVDVKKAFNNLKMYFQLIVTKDCYGKRIVSDTDIIRANEFNDLLNEDIKMISILRGGNFLLETLDKIDYKKLVKKNIWVEGYSDPTTLLYLLTVKYDLATIYGFNAKSYDDVTLVDQKNNLEIIQGKSLLQESFSNDSFSFSKNFNTSGVLIGGCLDALRNLFGTSFDATKKFLEKYQNRKIIWYFDIYEMNSVDTYLTLLQMKMMGYFQYSDTFLIGKIKHPKELEEISYVDAYRKVFGNQNVVVDTDIGHVRPSFTMINGSFATIKYQDGKMKMKMEKLDASNG